MPTELDSETIKYESRTKSSVLAKALGVLILFEGVIIALLVLYLEDSSSVSITWLLVLLAIPSFIFWMLWFHQLKVQINNLGIKLSGTKPLFGFKSRFIPFTQILEAKAGYHLDGIGSGFGIRKEGKGHTIWRTCGPEITLFLTDGSRLAMSVKNETEFLAALPAHLSER